MSRATQTLHTCDRCGRKTTSPLGTRKAPEGWRQVDVAKAQDFPLPPAIVAADLCGDCVQELARWFESGQHQAEAKDAR